MNAVQTRALMESEYPEFVATMCSQVYAPELVPGDVRHAVDGIASESGEIVDVLKKAFAYGKPIDFVNLDEEMGDLLWYIQLYANYRDKTIPDLVLQNRNKLVARYGDKFTQDKALNRDLDKERAVLEDQPMLSVDEIFDDGLAQAELEDRADQRWKSQ
jgi:NTP pyrophosphatase (non-canonical NTP hydrolase)